MAVYSVAISFDSDMAQRDRRVTGYRLYSVLCLCFERINFILRPSVLDGEENETGDGTVINYWASSTGACSCWCLEAAIR